MELSLQLDEAQLLATILERFVSNLRMEIGSTDNYDWRQSMKRDEATVVSLLERLQAAAPKQQ